MTSLQKKSLIALLIVVITYMHYATDPHHHQVLHVMHRVMYLIPIVLSAYWFGKKIGLTVSIISSILFLPQIFRGGNFLNSYGINSMLEVLIYNVLAYLIGEYHDIRKSQFTMSPKIKSANKALPENGRNILACIDTSQNASKTIPYIVENFARDGDMSITIMGLIREPIRTLFDNPEEFAQAEKQNDNYVSELISKAHAQLLSAGFPSESVTIKTSKFSKDTTAGTILAELRNSNYHTVVVGGSKKTRAEEFILGNMPVKLIRESNCPVITVF